MYPSDLQQDGTLKIGAVSRLTGLSAHTLRKWESRYNAVTPGRSEGGERVYTRADVERLVLIRRLVDAGVAPRDVARLALQELTRRVADMAAAQDAAGADSGKPVRVAVAGSAVAAMLERQAPSAGMLDIVASAATADALAAAPVVTPAELLVLDIPTVRADTRQQVDELMTHLDVDAAVIVYRFASRGDLLSLQAPALTTLRGPTDRRAIERVAVELLRPSRPAHGRARPAAVETAAFTDVPPPRLSREVVARLARISPRIRCECPHHLSEILLGLRAFEEYSAACESSSPSDAALHHYLWRSAAQARALFEDAIEHVAAAEGISLE